MHFAAKMKKSNSNGVSGISTFPFCYLHVYRVIKTRPAFLKRVVLQTTEIMAILHFDIM
jgi:hypothetical protein